MTLLDIDALADWSDWAPFFEAARAAPTQPGVYMMRIANAGIVYVGMAGPRKGLGIRGRLNVYRRGRGAASGFGQAAMDRALAAPAFIAQQTAALEAGSPRTSVQWARDAIDWWNPDVRWATTEDELAAETLEARAENNLRHLGLWNRRQLRNPDNSITVAGPLENLWTPETLAVELGVPAKTLRRWARGKGWRTEDDKSRGWSFSSEQAQVLRNLAGR